MSRKYKFKNPQGIYFVSFAVVYWIDIFTRREYKDIIIESLKFCQINKGLRIHAWCIMSSHLHLIISSENNDLPNILRDFKSYTSGTIRKAIIENQQESRKEWVLWMFKRAGEKNCNNNDFQFWQQHNNPIELFSEPVLMQKLTYLHNNPVEEGFVEHAEDYLYSSAKDYAGLKGLLEIIKIE